MYDHVLETSNILFTFVPLSDKTSFLATVQECSDNFQPCNNGMETGNNDITDNTARSVIHLRHWLPYAVFSLNWSFNS